MGSVGVEWCAGTSPFARAALREGRNCVSFERDESIIEAVNLALAQTMKSVVTSLGHPSMLKKRRRSEEFEEVPDLNALTQQLANATGETPLIPRWD
jgi:hypothetical protein